MATMFDPPSGWMYGFPKQLPDEIKDEDIEAWAVENGYPRKLADEGMIRHSRYWDVDDNETEPVNEFWYYDSVVAKIHD